MDRIDPDEESSKAFVDSLSSYRLVAAGTLVMALTLIPFVAHVSPALLISPLTVAMNMASFEEGTRW